MRKFLYVAIAAMALVFLAPAPKAQAQISIGIGVGPSCPYGYYGYGSYNCAPYGYYGPEWFSNGAFIGAGRYYHGGPGFYGHVNRSFDPRYGYRGAYPGRGPYQEHPDHFQSFHASHYSDPGGHYHTEEQHQGYVHGGDHH